MRRSANNVPWMVLAAIVLVLALFRATRPPAATIKADGLDVSSEVPASGPAGDAKGQGAASPQDRLAIPDAPDAALRAVLQGL